MLFIGIDLGTSGCRALAIDTDGQVCAEAQTPLPGPTHQGPAIEQDATIWWDGLCATLAQLLPMIERSQVKGLAVDGTSGTLLVSDANGHPIGPALMYNDARSSAEASIISQTAPTESAAHGASSALAKLLQLKPGPNARYALHQADWIVGKLSGRWGISDANNCLKLGYDAINRCWPDWLIQLLNAQDINPQLLPEVYIPGTSIAPISNNIASRFGLNANTQIIAGTTDSTAAFIATGASEEGDAVTSLGSTLVMKVISSKAIFSPQHGVYAQPLGNKWLVGGGSNSGGAVLRRYFDTQQMANMTPRLKPEQPTRLDYYPLLRPGERFPVCDAALPAKMTPRPDDEVTFFQAMLEGMAEIELKSYQLLERLGAPFPRTLRSAGGGSHNPAWTSIRQKRLRVPFKAAHHQEAAYGSALLARQGYRLKAQGKQVS